MSYPDYDRMNGDRDIQTLSRWIDDHNAHRDPEAQLWGRIAKVGEENGEVIAALIEATGQNPRKPQDREGGMIKVGKELLDSAVTALSAYEHVTGNNGIAISDLLRHLEKLVARSRQSVPVSVLTERAPEDLVE